MAEGEWQIAASLYEAESGTRGSRAPLFPIAFQETSRTRFRSAFYKFVKTQDKETHD
jgi:hypothetical protein